MAANKANSPRGWLKDSIRKLLIPEFEKRGFEVVPLSKEDARSEIGGTFPFGRLRRRAPDGGFEMAEIQLDKHGKPAFRLNLGIAPPGGLVHPGGHVPQEDVWVHYLKQYYSVYQWPWMRKWFSAGGWFGKSPTAADFEELVKRVVQIVPEIEETLREGKIGRHIRRIA